MAIERCTRCDRLVDLDWHVDDIIYIDLDAVCTDCATGEELDKVDAEFNNHPPKQKGIEDG